MNLSLPRVYADFNAIEGPIKGSSILEMPLTGYGTLASLARQKLQLSEGMLMLFFEPGDIECEATVHFDTSRKDPANRVGEWVAQIDPASIRDNNGLEESSNAHPCIVCGHDFMTGLGSSAARNYKEVCICCGASVMAPMANPENVV